MLQSELVWGNRTGFFEASMNGKVLFFGAFFPEDDLESVDAHSGSGHNKQYVEGGPQAHLAPPRSERIAFDSLVDAYTQRFSWVAPIPPRLSNRQIGRGIFLYPQGRLTQWLGTD